MAQMRETMSSFFAEQLDYIFFFYGFAFILLGAVCFAVSRSGQVSIDWRKLGAFAYLHGVVEWLDLSALVLGDSNEFRLLRLSLMTLSFVVLLDFARREATGLGHKVPGRWIYLPMLLVVFLGWYFVGTGGANAFARYLFGFPGAALSAVVLGIHARVARPAKKRWLHCAVAGFAAYAFLAGIVVPTTPNWDGDLINYARFRELTGMPVQLLRGLSACLIAFAIWAYWGERAVAQVGSPLYTRFQQRQFVWTLSAMGMILIIGWLVTQLLGDIYSNNMKAESEADLKLISSRLTAEVAIVDGMVKALAGTRSIGLLTQGDPGAAHDRIASHLRVQTEASGSKESFILGRDGRVLVASATADGSEAVARGKDLSATPFARAALAGEAGAYFTAEAGDPDTYYYASFPIHDEAGRVTGAAVLKKSLRFLDRELALFDRSFAFIDRDGIVLLSNRPDMRLRSLWPIGADRVDALSRLYGPVQATPFMAREIIGSSWVEFENARDFVKRERIDRGDWSIVTWREPRGIFASRVLGIAITLQMAIMVLAYLAGREHWTHDRVQLEKRLELEKLARDLGNRAATDALTGLYNRRRFDRSFAAEILRAQRYKNQLSLILWDIDHFKKVNDAHGHQVGDRVLVELSRYAAARIRSSDVLARWGGEEFVVLCPGSGGNDTARLAEHLLDGIRSMNIEGAGRITCSFGVAEYRDGDTPESMLARADEALYRAKSNGRARVELADQERAVSALATTG